jgi:hypothetical protein
MFFHEFFMKTGKCRIAFVYKKISIAECRLHDLLRKKDQGA